MKAEVEQQLQQWTQHFSVKVVPRCNFALFMALYIVKATNNKPVLAIPDQGGWLTYKQYPQYLGFQVVEYPTHDGIVDLDYLKQNVKMFAGVIVANPAGYMVEQPMEEIFSLCDGKTLVIEDVSGSIGSYCGSAHIKVGSFGKWKPVNVGTGGFISTCDPALLDKIKVILSTSRVEKEMYGRIAYAFMGLQDRYAMFYEKCDSIKQDLSTFDVVHRKAEKGIVVLVRYKCIEEKQKIIEYCEQHSLPITDCPRYIRLNDNAICVEVKRL